MALDMLQRFLGNNPQRQQDYADFAQRYQNDPNSISDEEAARRYRELMRNAPPDAVADAHAQALQQLPQQDRQELAQRFNQATQDPNRPFDGYNYTDPNQAADPRNLGRMAGQASSQDPNLLDQLMGPNSPLNSTLGRAAIAGAAAYLANRYFSGQGGNLGQALGGAIGQGQGSGIPGITNTGLEPTDRV